MDMILDTLGKVGFDWKMALFNFVNFLIVFAILKKYAFGPITKIIEERQKKVKDSVDNIQKAKTQLLMAESRAQELLDEAKAGANKVAEKAHEQGKVQMDKMKDKAKQEIALLVDQAKRNIEIDRKDMQENLRTETVELVLLAVEKIISEKLDDKKDEAYIKNILESLKK
jgi:F-type H+-transporting ATPase subunit b